MILMRGWLFTFIGMTCAPLLSAVYANDHLQLKRENHRAHYYYNALCNIYYQGDNHQYNSLWIFLELFCANLSLGLGETFTKKSTCTVTQCMHMTLRSMQMSECIRVFMRMYVHVFVYVSACMYMYMNVHTSLLMHCCAFMVTAEYLKQQIFYTLNWLSKLVKLVSGSL